jgi:hypothetical protein
MGVKIERVVLVSVVQDNRLSDKHADGNKTSSYVMLHSGYRAGSTLRRGMRV